MKKLLLIAAGLLLIINAKAQEQPKKEKKSSSPTMWVGGEVGFGNMANYKYTNPDYLIGPSFGMMIGESIAVGGTLVFAGGNNSSAWEIDPYFRYYLPITDKFSFYGDGFIGVGGGDDDSADDTKGEYSFFGLGARAGIQYWFTPNWSLAASTNVLTYDSKTVEGNSKDDFGIGASFNTVNFSFFYHF